MILVGIAAIALFCLAFAGKALGDPDGPQSGPSALDVGLFLLLLGGIVAKQHKARQDDEF